MGDGKSTAAFGDRQTPSELDSDRFVMIRAEVKVTAGESVLTQSPPMSVIGV